MDFTSKKSQLTILAITALVLSRIPFFFFNDPEGPNLLVVVGMAVIVFVVSLAVYFFIPTRLAGLKRVVAAIFVQIFTLVGFYFWLH